MYLNSVKNFTHICTAIFISLVFLLLPSATQAFFTSDPVDLDGYAWSSNIGWISMNCATGGVNGTNICGISNYKVTIQTDGSLTGYAWSNSIGWVRFGGLSNFPSGPGTVATNAQLISVGSTNYELRGWVRACGGAASVSGCTGGPNPTAGGWDGWISLKSNNHAVVFSAAGPVTNSYAWGSTVVGWIDMFSHVTFAGGKAAEITFGPPCEVAIGEAECTGQLSYQFFNLSGSDNPRVDRLFPLTPVSVGLLSGTNVSVSMRAGTNTYRAGLIGNSNLVTRSISISCVSGASPTGPGGICEPDVIAAPPTMNLMSNQSLVRKGDRAVLSISISGPNPVCTLSGPGIVGQYQLFDAGGVSVDSVLDLPNYTTAPLSNLARFSLTCSGVFSQVTTREIQVRVVPTFTE